MSNDPLHRAVVNNADRLELRSLSLSLIRLILLFIAVFTVYFRLSRGFISPPAYGQSLGRP